VPDEGTARTMVEVRFGALFDRWQAGSEGSS
jgi:hypothetical protein